MMTIVYNNERGYVTDMGENAIITVGDEPAGVLHRYGVWKRGGRKDEVVHVTGDLAEAIATLHAPERCPDCGGELTVESNVRVDEPYFPTHPLRDAPLPRRTRTAYAAAFCGGCEFCVEIERPR